MKHDDKPPIGVTKHMSAPSPMAEKTNEAKEMAAAIMDVIRELDPRYAEGGEFYEPPEGGEGAPDREEDEPDIVDVLRATLEDIRNNGAQQSGRWCAARARRALADQEGDNV